MRTFNEFAQDRAIKKYLTSSIGVLFYGADNAGRIIVRKFPSGSVANIYVEIFYAVKKWIDERRDICGIVDMLLPFEIGMDFVAREYQIYTSTDELLDEERDINLPSEFFSQQRVIKNALVGSGGSRNKVVEHVIQNSFLEPTGKTYFDFSQNKFVIVEPKILPIDIELWSESTK